MIETANLRGRRVTVDDLAFVVEVWNDPRVAPNIGGPRPEARLRDRIEEWTRHWDEHGFGATLFTERETGQAVGWGGLKHSTIGTGPAITVGYVIAPACWGRGYATEIAPASVSHAHDELGLDEVRASVLATNAASRRVLEKAGMGMVAEVDHGSYVEVVYSTAR